MAVFTDDIRTHVIDMTRAPRDRWSDVIREEADCARELFAEGWEDAYREAAKVVGGWSARLLLGAVPLPFAWLYRLTGGRHGDEIKAWADGLEIPRSRMVLMQCMYELSHLDPRPPKPACSAGVTWVEGLGMVHARTLDWNLASIAKATRIFEFHRGARRWFIVGIPGLLGALSGMVPGGYSVTINWAPPAAHPFFYLGPLFELREVLERCDTYGQAVEHLATRRLASSVFYTVCGKERGEGCVIEYVKTDYAGGRLCTVRPYDGAPLAQSNHYQHATLEAYNGIVDTDRSMLMRTSRERSRVLKAGLEALAGARTLDDCAAALEKAPVENEETQQKMVFCPAAGRMRVWRRL